MSIFTTREIATFVWIIILLIIFLLNKKLRKSLSIVIKLFMGKKLRIIWILLLSLVCVITYVFYKLPIWNCIYLKDIIFWYLFSGIYISMNAVDNKSDEKYIKNVLRDNIKFIIVLEFILSTFTFNIYIELLLIPLIFFLTIIDEISKSKEEYKGIKKIVDYLLGIIGIIILCKTFFIGISSYKNLNFSETFISFCIPIVYLILVIPYEFLLELYSKYENVFCRMKFMDVQERKLHRKHIFKVIMSCKFSIRKIIYFKNNYVNKLYTKMNEEYFNNLLNDFKRDYNKKNKNLKKA